MDLKVDEKIISLIKVMIAIITFTIGGYIYLAYRSTSLQMFEWFNNLGLHDIVSDIRRNANSNYLHDFVLYSLPDGLWIVSYILIMDVLWYGDKKMQIIWAGLLPAIGLSTEFLQITGIVNGTFDFYDILCYAVPYCIYITFKSYQDEKN